MMHLRRIVPIAWVIFSLFIISESAFAKGKSAEAKARHFGIGHPKTTLELPKGQFRGNLEQLSPKARGKAIGWLQRFEFPVEDVVSLHVSPEGEIFYADAFRPESADVSEEITQTIESLPVDAETVFQLHSNPGASNVVFLDFDGHIIESTSAWTGSTLVALPFDPSQNDSPPTSADFTPDEVSRIFEIWHRMAEDFAAFDIDVTTEEPPVFTPNTGHVLFTHTHDANGRAMPQNGGGGVAYVDVFGSYDYVTKYSPAIVYYSNLAIGSEGMPYYNAEAGSHEFGHNVGLSHDGTVNGITYYEGSGEGFVSWAPIMGKNYHGNVTIWSKGEYDNANNTQDDLAIIANHLGYRGDDHGDSMSQATPLRIEENGDILVSSPELDPENILSDNKGVIDSRGDTDWFYLDSAGSGSIDIVATPAWHSFIRTERRGANLDIDLSVYDENLQLVAESEPDNDTFAAVSVPVSTGRYYLVVDGVENFTYSDYSDYASTGMYFLEGSIITSQEPISDETPPSPGTMSWQSAPTAINESSIVMTASLATDESGGVQYQFVCVTGGSGCVSSAWQANQTYTATGLDADTFYAYKVFARDAHGNKNTASPTAGDNTSAIIVNLAPEAIANYTPDPGVIQKGNSVDITLDGSASRDDDGTIVSWQWQDETGATIATNKTTTLGLKSGIYRYTLIVTDDQGAAGSTTIEVSVSKPTAPPKSRGKKG